MTDTIDTVVQRFERNVESYKKRKQYGHDDVAECRKQSAYEDARILRELDDEIGDAAADYLRQNGI